MPNLENLLDCNCGVAGIKYSITVSVPFTAQAVSLTVHLSKRVSKGG